MTTPTPRSLLNKHTIALACSCILLVEGTAFAGAGGGYASDVAQREINRRTQRVNDAQAALEKGDKLYAQGEYEGALSEYKTALDLIPDAPLTSDLRARAQAKWADASVKLAEQRAQNGRYAEAKALLKDVLDKDPDHSGARILAKRLDDPERYNPALTPQHVMNVNEVKRDLEMANSYRELGDLDNANKAYQDTLRVDKYNGAARQGIQKVEDEKSRYFEKARIQTRSAMITAVNEGWEQKVPVAIIESDPSKIYGGTINGGAYYTDKMQKIIFPAVQFTGASIDEAIEFLRIKSKDLDTFTTDPAKRGVNLILRAGSAPSTAAITLDLKEVPMVEALRYITELAGMKYKVEPFAVVVVPATETTSEQFTRTFKVPPDFLTKGSGDGGAAAPAGAAPAADPFAAPAAGGRTGAAVTAGATPLQARPQAKDILANAGILFPEGSSAAFIAATSQLVVRNTQPQLDAIENFVETLIQKVPQQIFITTKFVEVQQHNTDELGFDWLLGPFNIPSSSRVFGSGGTSGNSGNGPVASTNYTFRPPGTGSPPIGINPLTAGNRSGGAAITPDSIDGLLNPSTGNNSLAVAPGIFSLAGVFTDPQFQVVIRALAQRKGTDLMSAPSVTTRSGQRANIEVVREFRYPTEFNPPQIPTNFGGGGGATLLGQTSSKTFPVTPTTPTAFEMRPVGVRMEVDPVLGPDGYTIDLNLSPEVTEFEGFINYGSPIQTSDTDALGNPITVVLTENKILQPVFSTRKVTTQVTIWDGQTVAIGGLIREDVQATEDKVPILGDIPWLGRLFQTKAEDHQKRNLMIFVTAKLMDPSGSFIHKFNNSGKMEIPSEATASATGGPGLLPGLPTK